MNVNMVAFSDLPQKCFHCWCKTYYCIYLKRFVGGELNTCYNAVDRHVAEGNGGQVAIIYDSPVTKQIKKITYRELWEEVFIIYMQKQNFKSVIGPHIAQF